MVLRGPTPWVAQRVLDRATHRAVVLPCEQTPGTDEATGEYRQRYTATPQPAAAGCSPTPPPGPAWYICRMRILVVEDDATLRDSVATYLRREGFAVDAAATGAAARELAAISPYDAVVLDVRLPDDDGFALCTAFRARRPAPRVLMATARDSLVDRIAGLDLGADDYLVKPYALAELVARIRALLRRPNADADVVWRVADLTLDPATRTAERGGRPIALTTKEYAVLEILMRSRGRVVTRQYISEHAWDDNFDPLSNVIDVYIGRLRRKIDGTGDTPLLETLRGTGYRMRDPGGSA